MSSVELSAAERSGIQIDLETDEEYSELRWVDMGVAVADARYHPALRRWGGRVLGQ